MVGFRVVDVVLLCGFLFWFFYRLLDDEDSDDDDERWDRDDEPQPEPPPALPGAGPWPRRLREHGDRDAPRTRGRRERTVTHVTRDTERTF